MFVAMTIIFLIGYVLIALEHKININKAATALIIAGLMWALYAVDGANILAKGYNAQWNEIAAGLTGEPSFDTVIHFIAHHEFMEHLSEIASIILFLMGAMGVVEVIDRFEGFGLVTDKIKTHKQVKLLWIMSIMAFFMSAVLDNLTTTIVMVTLSRKLVANEKTRWTFVGLIIIAANAGGAWSPIGDVTTIMLWIGGQISTNKIILSLFLPSLINLLVPLIVASFLVKGETESMQHEEANFVHTTKKERIIILTLGVAALLFVPLFKMKTHLPPYLGILLGFGVIWLVADILLHLRPMKGREHLNVANIVRTLDSPTILFFAGILTAVASLSSAGQLNIMASVMDNHIGNVYGINVVIGLLSSIVDNVPLVAGAMGMYPVAPVEATGYLANFAVDGDFWTFLAYCAGTGGSILIIGSAAGIAAMGMERITFGWYLKRISWLAFIGYFSGAAVYLLMNQ
jgi:Na+/H+ antiporter NhaD and related arsenite permeases